KMYYLRRNMRNFSKRKELGDGAMKFADALSDGAARIIPRAWFQGGGSKIVKEKLVLPFCSFIWFLFYNFSWHPYNMFTAWQAFRTINSPEGGETCVKTQVALLSLTRSRSTSSGRCLR